MTEEKDKLKRAKAAYAESAEPDKTPIIDKHDTDRASLQSAAMEHEVESFAHDAAPEEAPEILDGKVEIVEDENLHQEIANAQRQAGEYLDCLQRERADFSNYKKRIERDQVVMRQDITAGVIRRYLVVLDDLELAMKNRPSSKEELVSWADGIELIYRKFQDILEKEGVICLDAAGKEFDPLLHEALTHEDSENHESGQIIEVIQQGYMLGERLLRPARVRVAR